MADLHGSEVPLLPPTELSPAAELIYTRYAIKRRKLNTRIGRARNAVLTKSHGDREACALDNACHWGCRLRAIYNSVDELAKLKNHHNFRYRGAFLVTRLFRDGDKVGIEAVDRTQGSKARLTAKRVVLAAGTLVSTKLVLDLLKRYDRDIPLQTAPSAGVAIFVPPLLGQPLPQRAFGLAQLSFQTRIPRVSEPSLYAFGSIFAADSLSAPDLLSALPLTRRGGLAFIHGVLPALLIGLCYLPGEYSANMVRLTKHGECTSKLNVFGGMAHDAGATFRRTLRALASDFRRLGAWLPLASARFYPPGADVHYGATLPMGRLTTEEGEVIGAPGLSVVDGAVLPRIAAKHHTFTIMANADRIAKRLAARHTD
jgi:hypothetical protein